MLEHEEVLGVEKKLFFSILEDGTLATRTQPENGVSFHRKLDERFNAHLVKHWLDVLQTSHSRCHVADPDELEVQAMGSRVIDCQSKCLIVAPPNCDYVALSYVWGRREVGPFEKAP